MSGCLYMVGTPIGNLSDMSPRVAEAFRAADAICCEDTRVTSKLLAHLGISKTLIRCDENVIVQRAPELVDRLLAGETLAFAPTQACRAFPIRARSSLTLLAMRASRCR